jgi:zinc transporter, ZIP family
MGAAFFWGALASSSLLVGGALALRFRLSLRTIGLVMAFGAGVLVSAVAYDLVGEAVATAVRGRAVSGGLFAGCGVFVAGDWYIGRLGGAGRKGPGGSQSSGIALAIVLGIVLDGIPESIVLGLGLIAGAGISVALLVAVFLSNLPEAAAATTGLAASGWSRSRIYGLWALVTLIAGLSSLAGYGLLNDASPNVVAFVLAFAGGAILTMLANTMMPEGFVHGGRLAGVLTTLGFAVAFAISSLE